METPKKPPASITVTLNGEQKEIFMSFAKLNRCHYLVGENTDEKVIFANSEIREAILRHMVSDKAKLLELDDIDMSSDDVLRVLEFAYEHLMDFMLTAMEKAATLSEKHTPRAVALQKVMLGSISTSGGLGS